jgi:hypothetical protein
MNQEGARPESLAPFFARYDDGLRCIRRCDRGFDFFAADRLETRLAPHTPPAMEAIDKLI